MGEYTDRVRAEIVSDNVTRRILYAIFAVITVVAVFTLGGFAVLVAVVGLGPVLVLIVVIEIYCRIQNWRHLRVAVDADADLDKLRPEKSTEAPADVIDKLRKRANQAQNAGEPYLAADLRLAVATLERLNHDT
jgi:ABC-type multidrug transport system fused ATPase/permease subunit